jgi:hypothetical protein
MKICKKCNREFENEDTFCDKCGSKLMKAITSNSNNSLKNYLTNKNFLIMLGVIIVILILNFVFLKFYIPKQCFGNETRINEANSVVGSNVNIISSSSAAEKIVAMARAQGSNATLVSVVSENDLYKVTISIEGQEMPVYITKDGKLFTTQMMPVETGLP